MSRFLDDAQSLFDAAETACRSGQGVSDLTILIGAGGGIHMMSASDWPLDRLMSHHGAREAFRVGERNGRVRLEGREGARACVLESELPDRIARQLLNAASPWLTTVFPVPACVLNAATAPALPPASTPQPASAAR